MKLRVAGLVFLLAAGTAFAEDAPAAPVVIKGPHYTVTSWAGQAAGEATLRLMEALVVEYNKLFLFDLSTVKTAWNVVLYPNKSAFDAALVALVPSPPSDYLFLHYPNANDSRLMAWVPSKDSPVDEVRSLAFQGFYQFLWTFLPHPPAWIETGLATHFWNIEWNGTQLKLDPDWPYLPALKAEWSARAPSLPDLLAAPEGSLDTTSGKDLEAWGVVEYLLASPDPTTARLFGSLLANLSPTATEEENRAATLKRLQESQDLTTLSKSIQAWWLSQVGFQEWVDRGQTAMKNGDPQAALAAYESALALRPASTPVLYYAGLAAYTAKDYNKAGTYYAMIKPEELPSGLWSYAMGLNDFALKKYDQAKKELTAAKTVDAATYTRLVDPVLDVIP